MGFMDKIFGSKKEGEQKEPLKPNQQNLKADEQKQEAKKTDENELTLEILKKKQK